MKASVTYDELVSTLQPASQLVHLNLAGYSRRWRGRAVIIKYYNLQMGDRTWERLKNLENTGTSGNNIRLKRVAQDFFNKAMVAISK